MNVTFNTPQHNTIQHNNRKLKSNNKQAAFGELHVAIPRGHHSVDEFAEIGNKVAKIFTNHENREILSNYHPNKGCVTTYRLTPDKERFLEGELSQIPEIMVAHTEPKYDEKGNRVLSDAANMVDAGMAILLGLVGFKNK